MVYITIMSVCLVVPFSVGEFCVSFLRSYATMIDAMLLLEIQRWINASSIIAFALISVVAVMMVSRAKGGRSYSDIPITLESLAQTCIF
ncbi:unnamed protein product [Toxocara canis]|uniref:Ovule protein n=1 Tax=Toxocara canis TaxID=6265 RepID=A0A183TWM8_TOXCA|nr:unnamed protein product [Toxocara canis]